MQTRAKNFVTQIPAAADGVARAHFASKLTLETDCWDVHATLELEPRGFVLLDVRSPAAYDAGHLPGATNIPHHRLTAERLADYPPDTLFVTYCAGPHCNASTRAALRLAELGRPVKEMLGGTTGWVDEGFELVSA